MTDRYSTLRLGLVGAWCPSLGATGYTLLDRSGRNQHGTLTNMGGQSNWVATQGSVALAFDATNDFASIDASVQYLTAGQPFSLSWWEWPTGTGTSGFSSRLQLRSTAASFRVIRVNNDTNWNYMILGQSDNVGSMVRASGATPTGSALRKWTHFAVVGTAGPASKTPSDYVVYENGRSVAVAQAAFPLSESAQVNQIGCDSVGRVADARMDDVRVYDRALTRSEVALLASQRGIGLVPTRHRRARATTTMWLNVGGVWKKTTPHIRVGGVWKQATPKIRAGGAWKG